MDNVSERRYQVFISSTFRDLQGERQKVLQAVLELRAFPSGMEMFPSADDEQWQFIQDEILSSDYYVVIVAGKYGSLSETGQSFTEKEYDFAVQSGKPVMSFLVDDLENLKGSQLEQNSHTRNQLLAFREKVQRGKLVKFYRNSDELKAQVMQALVHAFQFRPQEGWMRAKNSRRLQDLEEITILQKRVMQLETENAEIRTRQDNPREEFLKESLKLSLNLKPYLGIDPPVAALVLEASHSELFKMCFERSFPRVLVQDIEPLLVEWLTRKIRKVFASESARLSNADLSEILGASSYNEVFRAIRNRLVGLGLVDVVDVPLPGDRQVRAWLATDRGRLFALTSFDQSESAETGGS